MRKVLKANIELQINTFNFLYPLFLKKEKPPWEKQKNYFMKQIKISNIHSNMNNMLIN